MNKIITIIKREFKENVLKKSFIISTILTPVILMGLVFLPTILTRVDVEEQIRLAVIDQSELVYPMMEEKLDEKLSDGRERYVLERVSVSSESRDSAMDNLRDRTTSENLNGFLVIPPGVADSGSVEYYSRNVANFDINRRIRNAITEIIVDHRLRSSGLEPARINELTRDVELRTLKIKKGSEESEGGFLEEYFGTFAFMMILYFTILMYGSSVMRGVLEEKNSRIIEVLLSTTNSFQLMVGKIIGLGSVGLAQYILWTILFASLILSGGALLPIGALDMNIFVFIYFILFFVLGYFLYATIYAGIGAVTNNEQEAQQLSIPFILMLIVPIITMTFIVRNPNSMASVILSVIPFFSPMLMFARINLSTPPVYEIWTAVLILLLSILASMWFVGKVYRIGILMYGKRPTFAELLRWFREK